MARTSKKKPPRPGRVKDDRGEYRSIYTVLPDSPEFRALSPHARSLIYPLKLKLGRAGIDVFYLEALKRLTGWDCEGPSKGVQRPFEGGSGIIARCVDELIETRWIVVQEDVVWMRNALRFEPSNPLGSPNGRKGVINHLLTLPKLPIINEFVAYYDLGNEWNAVQPEEAPTQPPSKPLQSPFKGGGLAGMRDEGEMKQKKEKTLSGQKESTSKRWRTVPDGWQPNASHRQLAAELQVDVDRQADLYRDHEFSKPKSDPDRTFNNWLRQAAEFADQRNGQHDDPEQEFVDWLTGDIKI